MNNQISGKAPKAQGQRGAVLILGLIMVLLMTIVALAAIRGSGLQETMAGNMRERNLAFQAAEAGLRVGEEFLGDNALSLSFDGGTQGLYTNLNDPAHDLNPIDRWARTDWNSYAIESGITLTPIGNANQPMFIIEKLEVIVPAGSDGGAIDFESQLEVEEVEYYRISSLGVGLSSNSKAVVQSTFRP